VFGHRPRLAHSHQGEHPHPLRRQVAITIAVATLLAIIALLLVPPHANGDFVLVKVTALVTFVPAGVAGVLNLRPAGIRLVKRRKGE
jgi:hypothetical protein